MFQIVIESGLHAGQKIMLREGDYTLGRLKSCDIHVADPSVSRQHLVIHVTRTHVDIVNQSKYQTLKNGEIIESRSIWEPGEHVQLGKSMVRMVLQAVQGDVYERGDDGAPAPATRATGDAGLPPLEEPVSGSSAAPAVRFGPPRAPVGGRPSAIDAEPPSIARSAPDSSVRYRPVAGEDGDEPLSQAVFVRLHGGGEGGADEGSDTDEDIASRAIPQSSSAPSSAASGCPPSSIEADALAAANMDGKTRFLSLEAIQYIQKRQVWRIWMKRWLIIGAVVVGVIVALILVLNL